MNAESNPPASGVRVPWHGVHPPVRAAVERFLGDPVAEATTQLGGFSPAAAVRLRTEGGRRAFVKAVGPEPNADTVRIYRNELRIAAALPADVPAPRLLTGIELDGWVALVFEDVEGAHPELPWRRDQLDRVLAALDELSAALTPSPIDLPRAGTTFGSSFDGWRRLLGEDTTGLDPWALRHLGGLAELESGWAAAAAGDTLVHADVRADNILLTDDRVHFVDWPWACLGTSWLDRVCLLPSVGMQGGPPPYELCTDPDPAITAVVAAMAGYFVCQGRMPGPPGLPTVRAFQRAQGVVALDWLRRRTGWA
ncbi:aminoglycoside phosphotransferase family protein [Nonomuraea sp. KC401]|uniref:aminoglycoside phosphotransferase family protein n=1 Tax=unclassified Nonomuraea TaxID=2593643 RepID=UPI0010FD8E33|nr:MULTISPECIES: aminoglycoside phosphotransferase family protein [unclassified Nonomuraea]NBE96154.1 phosphotransferase [Nonomuraea sp. K271]TLF71228.1 aminoglycoside phosphotransferase family protein [Nonomuraea sp. KC401]